jgi:transposase/type II secretory pathway pseudopilin PulG
MPTSYQPYAPDQDLLLPQSLQEWLPAGHLADYINDTIDALDLSAFFKRYEGGGSRNQPFHPAMMVKVLVYGYATGVFSSRKIARKLHEDVAFRVLAAGNFPKHRTLCDFRALHLKELAALFVQVVKLAGECGLVKLGTIAVDGTKLRANASKHKAMSYERMQAAELELKTQIDALLARAAQTDVAQADEPELDIPAEIVRREQRMQAIQAAKERLEARQRQADTQRGRKPDDDAPPGPSEVSGDAPNKPGPAFKRAFGEPAAKVQDNFTDPDSRIMKTSAGFEQCFNAQTAVDSHKQIIVAAELTHCAADSGELPGMLAAVTRNTGHDPEVALADAGYRSEAVLAQLSTSPTEIIVALGREGKKQVAINADKLPHTAAMATKLQSVEGRAKYRRRKVIVEPPNAWIKQVLGFRQFSFRGLDKVRSEFKLVCAALNLRRMAAMTA